MTTQVNDYVCDFMSQVLPPNADVGYTELWPFEEAVEYAVNCRYHKIGVEVGEALLEALRAKWPNDVEKVLAKSAVA